MGRACPLTTEVRWMTLRAWVCRSQRLQPIGRISQRRRVGTYARASKAMNRSTIVNDHRECERQDASDVQRKGVTRQRLWLPNVLIEHVMVARGHGQRLDCDAQVDPDFNAKILADDPTGLRVVATAIRPCHDITGDNLAIRPFGLLVTASSTLPPDHGRINAFLHMRSEPATEQQAALSTRDVQL